MGQRAQGGGAAFLSPARAGVRAAAPARLPRPGGERKHSRLALRKNSVLCKRGRGQGWELFPPDSTAPTLAGGGSPGPGGGPSTALSPLAELTDKRPPNSD